MEKMEKKINKKTENYILGGLLLIGLIYIFYGEITKPNSCDCVEILQMEKANLRLSNEQFKFWEKCYDEYTGPAGAILDCYDK